MYRAAVWSVWSWMRWGFSRRWTVASGRGVVPAIDTALHRNAVFWMDFILTRPRAWVLRLLKIVHRWCRSALLLTTGLLSPVVRPLGVYSRVGATCHGSGGAARGLVMAWAKALWNWSMTLDASAGGASAAGD